MAVGIRGRVSVGEARSIGDVGGGVGMPGQIVLGAEVQGVALVMIEKSATATEREISEAAVDAAASESELIRIGQVELRAIADARGAQSDLPSADASALNGDGEEQIGVVEIVVVEEVRRAGEEIVGVENPASEGDGNSELVFLVTFAVERNESKILASGGLLQGAGHGQQRRGLVKVTIKATKDPFEFGNAYGSADAGAGSVLDDDHRTTESLNGATVEMCLANASAEREPGCGLELIFSVSRKLFS